MEKFNVPQHVAEFLVNMIVAITIVLKMLYALLVPIAGLIGKFMSNDWVTGTVFRLDVFIETIWQFVRNMVNVIIVLYLVYVAARNIVPFGDNGQYDIKQVLPRVALALVVVNFSLFFCRTVLSVANLTTTMAFSMPNQIGDTVFPEFSAVPDFDANGNLPAKVDGKYPWTKSGCDKTKSGTDCAIPGTPFNPFVWAEPLGQTERSNLITSCPDGYSSSYTYRTENDGRVSAVSRCVKLDKDKKPVLVDGKPDEKDPNTIAGTSTIYAMECLHKNYAFNFSDALFSSSGPTLIANPGFVASSQKYVMQPSYYKRILIQQELELAQKGTITTDQWNALYADKQAEVLSQKNRSLQKSVNGASVPAQANDVYFPYYSDCVNSLDDLAFSARNAMYVYAFNLLRIPSYEKSFTDIQSYSDITVRILMSFFFLLMFFGVTVALLIAMVARTFYLWAMMALSPVWVLTDIIKVWKGDDVDQEGFIGGYGKFLSLAFLPTLLGVILSVGFMMYHFLSLAGGAGGESRGRFNVGSISIWFNPGDPAGGLGDLFSTMFGIFALAALWVAVFAAFRFGFKSMKFVSGVLEGFNKQVSQVAGYVAKTPLEAQILPFGRNGQGISARALFRDIPQTVLRNKISEREQAAGDILRNMGLERGGVLSVSDSNLIKQYNENKTPQGDKLWSTVENARSTYEGKGVSDAISRAMFKDGRLRREDELTDIRAGNFNITKENMQDIYRKKFKPKEGSAEMDAMARSYQNPALQEVMRNGNYSSAEYLSHEALRNNMFKEASIKNEAKLDTQGIRFNDVGAGTTDAPELNWRPTDKAVKDAYVPAIAAAQKEGGTFKTSQAGVLRANLMALAKKAKSEQMSPESLKQSVRSFLIQHANAPSNTDFMSWKFYGTNNETMNSIIDNPPK